MSHPVNVTLESLNENVIQEITYDGTEILAPPLTLSESLIRNACRIDFSRPVEKSEAVKGVPIKVKEIKEDPDAKDDRAEENQWAWESVRNKLRDALTEVSVLSDVLAVAKGKQYMVLDPVPHEHSQIKPMVQVYARKKALSNAANHILAAVERLKCSQTETKSSRNESDFHSELLRLRRHWRLKKVGNTILGDLSYRTAGSKFHNNGTFEVSKSEDEPDFAPKSPIGIPAARNETKSSSALRVTVPTELQGVAYIKVSTQKDQEDLCTAVVNLVGHGQNVTHQTGIWQKSLEYAQNVLFCKELFNQLAREAIQLEAAIPHVVVGNQIRATLLPGIQLIISLCHSTSYDPIKSNAIADHDHVLEHSLHQLLREIHYNNTHQPLPHLNSTIGQKTLAKKRIIAGPMAADRTDLLEMTKTKTILEQIIGQAQHTFMRKRTQYVLDALARDVRDPQIISHWNSMSSPTMSCVKIHIVSYSYDVISRSTMLIHVKERSLKCITRDGLVMKMSYEPQELRDLILYQINQHQIAGLQLVAKCMAWQTIANSHNSGVGPVQPLANATTCLLISPNGDRMIAARIACDPRHIDASIHVAVIPDKILIQSDLAEGKPWDQLNVEFKQVRFERLEGKNFLSKMEHLMAALSTTPAIKQQHYIQTQQNTLNA